VTDFLVDEGEKPAYIHENLLTACAEVTVDMNSVQWCVRWITKLKQEEQHIMTNC
jgi:hypothetical protein